MANLKLLSFQFVIASAVASTAAGACMAGNTVQCTEQPRTQWLDRHTIKKRIGDAGYTTIVILDVRGSCYHARALLGPGHQADVYLDPTTGDVVSAAIFDE